MRYSPSLAHELLLQEVGLVVWLSPGLELREDRRGEFLLGGDQGLN